MSSNKKASNAYVSFSDTSDINKIIRKLYKICFVCIPNNTRFLLGGGRD